MSAIPAQPTAILPLPSPSRLESRETILAAVLNPSRLPTPPVLALQIVNAASLPNCRPGEIVSLLCQDPALCAKMLKAVNSSLYGLVRPIGSIERAVIVLGMNKIRSLALGLSMPAMRQNSRLDTSAQDYWLGSVGGAIIARELAARFGYASPEDYLVTGLLREIGKILLRQAYPDRLAELNKMPPDPLEHRLCERERQLLVVDHAEVSAELLRGWNLPESVIEPIRHHHHPELCSAEHKDMAEILWFAGMLTRMELLANFPIELDWVIEIANDRFQMSLPQLAEFLDTVAPKIDQMASLLSHDIGVQPSYSKLLKVGVEELALLTSQDGNPQQKGNTSRF